MNDFEKIFSNFLSGSELFNKQGQNISKLIFNDDPNISMEERLKSIFKRTEQSGNDLNNSSDQLDNIKKYLVSSFNDFITSNFETFLSEGITRDELAKILSKVDLETSFVTFKESIIENIKKEIEENKINCLTFKEINTILLATEIENLINNNIIMVAMKESQNPVEIIGTHFLLTCLFYSNNFVIDNKYKNFIDYISNMSLNTIQLGTIIKEVIKNDSGFIPHQLVKTNIELVDNVLKQICERYIDIVQLSLKH